MRTENTVVQLLLRFIPRFSFSTISTFRRADRARGGAVGPHADRGEKVKHLARGTQFELEIHQQSQLRRLFHDVSEAEKFEHLAASDLLVLPSNCSNEAFGIVQLEAMAAGRIALAFDQPRSGMSWVSSLTGLHWSQSREGLSEVLQRLADHPAFREQLCVQARERYSKLFSREVWLQELQRFSDLVEGGRV